MNKIFLIEQLTADKTDYTVTGMTPNFEHAIALANRNSDCNISEWEYDSNLLQYRYVCAYDCNGNKVKEQ